MKKYIIALALLIPLVTLAGAGLGMSAPRAFNLGELKKGYCYDVGIVSIINYRGDETGTYQMSVTYHQDWSEMRTPADWIVYTPQRFTLEPNEAQAVEIDVCIPKKVVTGDYGSYLEAGVESDGNIKGAVATKLFFTVVNRRVK